MGENLADTWEMGEILVNSWDSSTPVLTLIASSFYELIFFSFFMVRPACSL